MKKQSAKKSVNKSQKEKTIKHQTKAINNINQSEIDNLVLQINKNNAKKNDKFLQKKRLSYEESNDYPISTNIQNNEINKKTEFFSFKNSNGLNENNFDFSDYDKQEASYNGREKINAKSPKIQKIRNKIENLKVQNNDQDQEFNEMMNNYDYILSNSNKDFINYEKQDRKINLAIKSKNDVDAKVLKARVNTVTYDSDDSNTPKDYKFQKPNKAASYANENKYNNVKNEDLKKKITSNKNLNVKINHEDRLNERISSKSFKCTLDPKRTNASTPIRKSNFLSKKIKSTTSLSKVKIPSNNISNKDRERSMIKARTCNNSFENSLDSKYLSDRLNKSFSYKNNLNKFYYDASPIPVRSHIRSSSNSLKDYFSKADNRSKLSQNDSILGNKFLISNPSIKMNIFYSKFNQNQNNNREEEFVIKKKPEFMRSEKETFFLNNYDHFIKIIKNSKIFPVREKAKHLINNFTNLELSKKMKEIYLEITENYGGYFTSLINNHFSESYLNLRHNNNLMSYYRDYMFHYEIYSKFNSDYQNTIKKECLVDYLMKINIERIINAAIRNYNQNESFETSLESLKLSFNSPFHILRNFLLFMNIDAELLNIRNYYNEIKKSDLYEFEVQLNDQDFIGFSNKKLKTRRIQKSAYLHIMKDILLNAKNESSDNYYKENSKKENKDYSILEDYFSFDKIILKELVLNFTKNNKNLNHDDQEMYERIITLKNKLEIKYQTNFDPEDLTFTLNKIELKHMQLFEKELLNFHLLLKYESKFNLLFSPKENLVRDKNSPCISFLKKNGCRFIQAEKFGFRSIKINFGPGDLLFIGIPSESKLEFIRIMREKYFIDPLEWEAEAFPDLDFFLRHNIKIYAFTLRKGDILNMETGVFYMFKAIDDCVLAEWNLLRDDENEIKNAFEFASLYKQSGIKHEIAFYNLFIDLNFKSAIKSALKTEHFIKTQLKKVFNEEIHLEDIFQKQFRKTKIKFSPENKVT